jgi:hypothetical protein
MGLTDAGCGFADGEWVVMVAACVAARREDAARCCGFLQVEALRFLRVADCLWRMRGGRGLCERRVEVRGLERAFMSPKIAARSPPIPVAKPTARLKQSPSTSTLAIKTPRRSALSHRVATNPARDKNSTPNETPMSSDTRTLAGTRKTGSGRRRPHDLSCHALPCPALANTTQRASTAPANPLAAYGDAPAV